MRKAILVFWGIMVLACAEKVIDPPENLISEDEMADFLYDLALLKATNNTFAFILEKDSIEIMTYLFNKYRIDSTQYADSDRYYASIPLQYQMIYEKVETRLEERRKVLEEANKRRNDSTRTLQTRKSDSIYKLQEKKRDSSGR